MENSSIPGFAAVCLLAGAAMLWVDKAGASDRFLTVSGVSHHFQSRQNGKSWNERNYGLGLDWQYREGTLNAGYYRNSLDRSTFYAGGRWEPLQFSGVRLGVQAMLASGYRSPVVGALSLSVTGERAGIVLLGVPRIGNKGTDAIGLQLRLAF